MSLFFFVGQKRAVKSMIILISFLNFNFNMFLVVFDEDAKRRKKGRKKRRRRRGRRRRGRRRRRRRKISVKFF